MQSYVYKNDALARISFPLGGLGTGCIGLAGNGRLIDWEMVKKTVGFHPVRMTGGRFRSFWSLASGWGTIELGPGSAVLTVLNGRLELSSLSLDMGPTPRRLSATLAGRRVPCRETEGQMIFTKPITIREGLPLRLAWTR
ncbi:MAG: hypothetical protein HY343_06675 [Lentisphaerae bacterium]|nr:hypothetical protein [Lentisphaerota bacterium]